MFQTQTNDLSAELSETWKDNVNGPREPAIAKEPAEVAVVKPYALIFSILKHPCSF